jgi:hypothetical protein
MKGGAGVQAPGFAVFIFVWQISKGTLSTVISAERGNPAILGFAQRWQGLNGLRWFERMERAIGWLVLSSDS